MGATNIYVLMSEKATEIQTKWNPVIGDYVKIRNKKQLIEHSRNIKYIDDVTIVLGIDDEYDSHLPIIGNVTDYGLYPECSWVRFEPVDKNELIWLPKQDQLQVMLDGDNYVSFYNLVNSLSGYETLDESPYKIYATDDHPIIPSMEQIWLTYVMEQIYNKKWIDNEWISLPHKE
jgi:hypothetical protein